MYVLSETVGGVSRTGSSGLAYKNTDITFVKVSGRVRSFSISAPLHLMLEDIAAVAGFIVNIICCRCSKDSVSLNMLANMTFILISLNNCFSKLS